MQDKRAQESISDDELREILESTKDSPEYKYWSGAEHLKAARRFFQIWNEVRGGSRGAGYRKNRELVGGKPLKCSIWRHRVPNYAAIYTEIIRDNIVKNYFTALEKIYPQIAKEIDPRRLTQLEFILGLGGKASLSKQVDDEFEKAPTYKVPEGSRSVEIFYKEIEKFPKLQEIFLKQVIDDVFTDYTQKNRIGGYNPGEIMLKHKMRSNQLLTFYLMKDAFPYLDSIPVDHKSIEELKAAFPQGNPQAEPLNGVEDGSGEKTYNEVTELQDEENPEIRWWVKNVRNPDYDFVKIDNEEIANSNMLARRKREIAHGIHDASLFTPNFFLAKNVFSDIPGFEKAQGVRLMDLGFESAGKDIPDERRDLTDSSQYPDAGLFFIPKQGLPQGKALPAKEVPEQLTLPVAPPAAPPAAPTAAMRTLYRSKNGNKTNRNIVIAQAAVEMWIDDQGNEFGSQEEIEETYTNDVHQAFLEGELKNVIEEVVRKDIKERTDGIVLPSLDEKKEEPEEQGGIMIPDTVPEEFETIEVDEDEFQPDEFSTQEQERAPMAMAAAVEDKNVKTAEEFVSLEEGTAEEEEEEEEQHICEMCGKEMSDAEYRFMSNVNLPEVCESCAKDFGNDIYDIIDGYRIL